MKKIILLLFMGILFSAIIVSCKKDKSTNQVSSKEVVSLLNSAQKPTQLPSTYNRAGITEDFIQQIPKDSPNAVPHPMQHIAEGDNKTFYVPQGYTHINEGDNKTLYTVPGHASEGPDKTTYPADVIHVKEGPDKTKLNHVHVPEGVDKTRYKPYTPGYQHIDTGANKTLYKPVKPAPGTWVHIIDGPQKTLYVQTRTNSGLRSLPIGYTHFADGANKSYYGRQ